MSDCSNNGCGCSATPTTNQPSPSIDHNRVQYRIENMDCPTEEALIRNKLGALEGVTGLQFNLMQRTLTVNHNLNSLAPIEAVLKSIGMQATQIKPTDTSAEKPAPKTKWWPLAVSGVTAILAEGVYWIQIGNDWAVIGLSIAAILLGGLPTYKKGWIALKNGNLNMNALMSIAVTGAMFIGHWPEAAMVMFLFAVAELIEAK